MKQLLIVNSAKALNAKRDAGGANVTPYNLSNLAEGAITFFELGGNSALAVAPTKNFGIALGRGENVLPTIIPEVDYSTLTITKALPKAGTKFSASFTVPTTVVGINYTAVLVKSNTVPHERNTWTATEQATVTTASAMATALVNDFNNKFVAAGMNISASAVGAVVTLTATDYQDYNLKLSDGLSGVSVTTSAHGVAPIGDKAYVQNLASQCAAGKGFEMTYGEGKELYSGYPEPVENLIPNTSGTGGVSTAGYAIYSLHFATKREAGKQLNELVWQYVHIAVPITNSSYSTIDGILTK